MKSRSSYTGILYAIILGATFTIELIYAFASFLLFGLAQINGGLYGFVFTGILGFSFAVIYLKSHNIVIPMGLHFLLWWRLCFLYHLVF